MKKEEKIVKEYLETLSSDVVYEPDGNMPPDFKLNQIIAVEVRRLNKNIFIRKKPTGLEQERFRLLQALYKVLREFDSSIPSDNYWIGLRFFRPIGKISNIERAVRTELINFFKYKPPMPYEIKLSRNVSITVLEDNRKSNKVFDIGIELDLDSGGFVAHMYIENINHCIAEKTKKIQAYKSNYCEW